MAGNGVRRLDIVRGGREEMVEVAPVPRVGHTGRGEVGEIALGEGEAQGPRPGYKRALRRGQDLLERAAESGVGLSWGPAAAGERGGRREVWSEEGRHGVCSVVEETTLTAVAVTRCISLPR